MGKVQYNALQSRRLVIQARHGKIRAFANTVVGE